MLLQERDRNGGFEFMGLNAGSFRALDRRSERGPLPGALRALHELVSSDASWSVSSADVADQSLRTTRSSRCSFVRIPRAVEFFSTMAFTALQCFSGSNGSGSGTAFSQNTSDGRSRNQ